jgi:hypothetical protein
MIRLFIIPWLIIHAFSLHAQDHEQLFDRLFSEIFVTPDNVENLEEVYQQLYYYYHNPVNLNKASAEELRTLLVLNEQQVADIIQHRERTGNFLSLYELQAIPSLSIHDLRLIIPFIAVNEVQLSKESNDYLLIRYERDLELRKGYKPIPEAPDRTPYLGTPDKMLLRMRSSIGQNISYGLLMEKDAGENIIMDPGSRRYGVDHYSAYVLYQGSTKLEKVIAGDYQLQFGQGLVYSSGFSLGKSAGDIGAFRRISTGIRPHSSTMESGFLRGIAATFRNKRFSLTGFASVNNNDASLEEDQDSFSGFNASGLHRTKNEISRKDNLQEKHAGMVIDYKGRNFNGGIGFSTIQLSSVWKPANRLYNVQAFSGGRLNTIFNFINYRWRNINFFMENAHLQDGGFGAVGGFLVNLSSGMQSGFILRNYEAGFRSLYGNAIGEKTSNSNERGILWVVNWQVLKPLHFSFYMDKFTFPWLSYQISQPSDGYEYLFRLRYNLSRKSYFLLQYKEEEKGQDLEGDHVNYVLPDKKRNYQMVIHYPVSESLTFRTRIQGSTTSLSGGNGVAMMQDLAYQHMKFKLNFRYSIFNIDDFDNRQYAYENDVLYSFNFPALQGRGKRFYALVKYNIGKRWRVWGKYSRTVYEDREEISSGNELIDGNKLSEVKLQVMYKL